MLSVSLRPRPPGFALDVAFEAPTPGVVALFGPSGSGKSSVVAAVAGLLRAEHCEVLVDGEALSALAPERRRVGLVFQDSRLFPHMAELRAAHPELHLDIDTAGHGIARLGDGLDAVIAIAREIDPALYSKRLDRNSVFVIGNRSLLTQPDPVVRPEQLATQTVLIHRDMPDTFAAWRAAAGVDGVEPLAIDQFDSGALMLEAAAQGLGVAFMHGAHFEDARDERLVKLFGIEVESPYSYWFVCRPRAFLQRPVRMFHDWLVRMIADKEGAGAPPARPLAQYATPLR